MQGSGLLRRRQERPVHPPAPAMRPQRMSKYKSAYMRKPYTIEEARVFFKHLTDASPYNGTGISMDSFGGAASKPGLLEETSDAHRSSIMKMQFISSWSNPSENQARLDHMRQLLHRLCSRLRPMESMPVRLRSTIVPRVATSTIPTWTC